jgi:hypothetical protein
LHDAIRLLEPTVLRVSDLFIYDWHNSGAFTSSWGEVGLSGRTFACDSSWHEEEVGHSLPGC